MPIEDRNGKWYLRFQVEGKKVHVSTGLKATERNRKKAEVIEMKEREALCLGLRFNIKTRENRTFTAAAVEFSQWLESEHGETPSTLRAYRTALKSSRRFFKDRIVSSIDSGDVEQFKVARSGAVKPSTVRMSMLVLTKFFSYCKKRNWCSDNPADDVASPSIGDSGRVRVLSYEEEKKYLDAVGDNQDLRDFVIILINHGLRPNEILHLRKEDVNLDLCRFVIQEGKTSSARRTVHLTPETYPIFERRLNGLSEWVFPRRNDPAKPFNLGTLEYQHRQVRKKIGFDFIFYHLRHTFATRVLEGGASDMVVAKFLGHVNLATVHKYLHPSDAMLIDAMQTYSAARQLKLAS